MQRLTKISDSHSQQGSQSGESRMRIDPWEQCIKWRSREDDLPLFPDHRGNAGPSVKSETQSAKYNQANLKKGQSRGKQGL